MRIILFIAFCCILMSSSCEHPSQPIKVDPCAGAKSFKASFTIYEQLWYDSLFVASDTVLRGNTIHFIADDEYDNYTWKIGTDTTVFIGKSVRLKFDGNFNKISIRLIASKKASSCYPNDKTIDTITKFLTVVDDSKSAFIGYFRGVSTENLKDTFDIHIYFKEVFDNNGQKKFDAYFITNFNNGCPGFFHRNDSTDWPYIQILRAYKTIKIDGTRTVGLGCFDPYGYAQLNNDNSVITIDYVLGIESKVRFKFVGRRI